MSVSTGLIKNWQCVGFTVGILKNSGIPVGKLDGFSYLLTSTLTLLMSVSTGLIKIDNVLFIQRTWVDNSKSMLAV